MAQHTIRLLGPWEWQALTRTVFSGTGTIETRPDALPAPRRVWIPVRSPDAELAHFRGRVCWRRYFHWTSQLDYWERIWLHFESADYFAQVRLNGILLGEHEGALDPFSFPITSLLQKRNCLEVELEVPETPPELSQAKRMLRETPFCSNGPALFGEVRLEVYHPTRFGDLSVATSLQEKRAMLHIRGEIYAETPCQPELYVVYDNHTLHYEKLDIRDKSHPLALEIPVPRIYVWDVAHGRSAALHYVQIELADRSVMLDARYCNVGFRRLDWHPRKQMFRLNEHWLSVGSEVAIVDIQSPVSEGKPFESADEVGQPVLCRLPLRGGYAEDATFRRHAVEQGLRLVRLLQHHPCILGWIVHTEPTEHDHELDAALAQAIRNTDPTRPVFIQPRADALHIIAPDE
ncbi:MAG: hypothetical protein RMI91_13895 [Gemmatales bacterium]|nr:hypothetical protein [Gemmatales bacterium]MDW7995737.1 hypothetical protein [Gemmatales bacterium]